MRSGAPQNQDAGVAWRGERELAVIVSDGMGGHAAGREAAEIVVRVCVDSMRNRNGEEWCAVLRSALGAAHAAVLGAAQEMDGQGQAPMGATAAVAVVELGASGPVLHVAHVGDSRVYLCRGRSICRLTDDHSLVGQMVRDGLLSEEEAFGHPDSNVIQRAIGQAGELEVEIQAPALLDRGDVVVLSSDGLHGSVPDLLIADVVERGGSAKEICQSLLHTALEARSQDNITIACIRVISQRPPLRTTRVDRVTGCGEAAKEEEA